MSFSADGAAAKAYHVLMELQAMAYNFAVAPRLGHPRVFQNTSWQTEMYTLGGNGADFDYRTLFLDGTQTYRLTGNARDSQLMLGQLSSSLPGVEGTKVLRPAKNFDFSSFKLKPDGSFEVILSADKHEGNWIELDRSSRYQWILFRPTVETPEAVPAELHIERISSSQPDDYGEDDSPAAIASRIDMATGFVRYMVSEWVIKFYQRVLANAGGMNKFATINRQTAGEVGSPSAEYVLGAYEVKDGEALIIEMDEPKASFWSMQTFDVWLRSIDFRTRQTSLNSRQTVKDSDGKVRFVVSRKDPGVANWIDTVGIDKGQILLRLYQASQITQPTTRLVKLAELERHLPRDTKKVTPAERAKALEIRRQTYLRRHGE